MTWFAAAFVKLEKSASSSSTTLPLELENFYLDNFLRVGDEKSITKNQLKTTFEKLWTENPFEAVFFSQVLTRHLARQGLTETMKYLRKLRENAYEKEPGLSLVVIACVNAQDELKKLQGPYDEYHGPLPETHVIVKAIAILKESAKKDPEILNSPAMNTLANLQINWNVSLNNRLDEIMGTAPIALSETNIQEACKLVNSLNLIGLNATQLDNPNLTLYPKLFIGKLAIFASSITHLTTPAMINELDTLFNTFDTKWRELGEPQTYLWQSLTEQFSVCAAKLEANLPSSQHELSPGVVLLARLMRKITVASSQGRAQEGGNESQHTGSKLQFTATSAAANDTRAIKTDLLVKDKKPK